MVRDAREVVFVAKAAGRATLFNSIQVGARLPAHATVLGRVLLANLTMGDLKALYAGKTLRAFTPQTPTTLVTLKAMIVQDAARGYGISQGGFESGISTIAAPVMDGRHAVTAAISVTVPEAQVGCRQPGRAGGPGACGSGQADAPHQPCTARLRGQFFIFGKLVFLTAFMPRCTTPQHATTSHNKLRQVSCRPITPCQIKPLTSP